MIFGKTKSVCPVCLRVADAQKRSEKDGIYLIINLCYERDTMNFTVEGGWNTHWSYSGELCAEHALGDDSVRFWLDVEDPEVTP